MNRTSKPKKMGLPMSRSEVMARVRSKNTGPELRVRRLAHALGYRYRLHGRGLPGSPDLVFAGRRKVIFVNGCFWHGHACKAGNRLPKTRVDFWRTKIEGNMARDALALEKLGALGWEAMLLWECELRDEAALTVRLLTFLGERSPVGFVANLRDAPTRETE